MPTPTTVAQYLAALPADRRAEIETVLAVVRRNLDKDYEEEISYGMIGWVVPKRIFPAGYHCNPKLPLPLGGISSRKSGMSLHLMSLYMASPLKDWFLKAWKKTGKKLDMGAACIRFKKADDLALDVLGEAVRRVPVKKYVEIYTGLLGDRVKPAAKKKAVKKGE